MPLPFDDGDEANEDPATRTIRYAAGARDGISTHHMGQADVSDEVDQLLRLIVAYCDAPSPRAASMVEAYAVERQLVHVVDPLIEQLPRDRIQPDVLAELAQGLAMRGTQPEPVKLGIALLGMIQGPVDDLVIRTLGSHDEFALFAGVAVLQRGGGARELWQMAQRVKGWGRVHLVEQIVRQERIGDAIREWLLREGFKNDVLDEYLALRCATAGDLRAAIVTTRPPVKALHDYGRLIESLIRGGPAPGIEQYEDAAAVLSAFVGHVRALPAPDLRLLSAIQSIESFVKADEADPEQGGWSDAIRGKLANDCAGLLETANARAVVERGLADDDATIFALADGLAQRIGVDGRPARWSRWTKKPTDRHAFYLVSESVDASQLDDFLGRAAQTLTADQIATGPAESLGFGRGFEPHGLLDYVLQALRRFPGRGEAFIEMALRSPVVRNRNMALAALAEWDEMPESTTQRLADALRAEPNGGVRRRMANVLEGRPLDDGSADDSDDTPEDDGNDGASGANGR